MLSFFSSFLVCGRSGRLGHIIIGANADPARHHLKADDSPRFTRLINDECRMSTIRPAAVAGLFYPDNPIELTRTVADLLAHAGAGAARPAPQAQNVPHAGYIFSGAVAASAYSAKTDLRSRFFR